MMFLLSSSPYQRHSLISSTFHITEIYFRCSGRQKYANKDAQIFLHLSIFDLFWGFVCITTVKTHCVGYFHCCKSTCCEMFLGNNTGSRVWGMRKLFFSTITSTLTGRSPAEDRNFLTRLKKDTAAMLLWNTAGVHRNSTRVSLRGSHSASLELMDKRVAVSFIVLRHSLNTHLLLNRNINSEENRKRIAAWLVRREKKKKKLLCLSC